MTVLQCGGCERLISVSIAPGGNPVALADPARWSITRTVCPACRKSLCDRCVPRSAARCPLCKAPFAAAEDENDEDAGIAMRTELVEARRWLAAAFLAAIVACIAFLGKGGTANLVTVAIAVLVTATGATNGVERLARVGMASRGWKALGFFGIVMPYVAVLPLAWLCWRSHARLAALYEEAKAAQRRETARERARRRAQENAPAREPAAAPARVQPASRGSILQAVASLKQTELQALPDGQVLKIQLAAGNVQLAEDQQPVLVTYQGFGVFFLIDDGDQYHYANHAEMQAAGLTPQTLLETGLGNLARRIAGSPGLQVAPHGAMQALLLGGDFEASLLLIDELWDRALAQHAPNGVVAAIPARDICAFADRGSREGIAELRALVARIMAKGDHTLTATLFERRAGRWLPLP